MRKQAGLLTRLEELSSDISCGGGKWQIYRSYEITRSSDRGARFLRVRNENNTDVQLRSEYQPLQKYPDLFLRFARLADDGGLDRDPIDSEKNAEAALAWAHEYGGLGLTPSADPSWGNEPLEGHRDTVAAFASEAWRANIIMKLYEAATNPSGVDIDVIASCIRSPLRHIHTKTPEAAARWAVTHAAREVNDILREHTCTQIYMRKGDHRFMGGHDFRSLLGAMYLQAMWMLQADKPLRCRRPECPKIIDFDQPDRKLDPYGGNDRSMGYRTRSDREYCSKKCSNRHYYERETKPRRKSRQSRRKP